MPLINVKKSTVGLNAKVRKVEVVQICSKTKFFLK